MKFEQSILQELSAIEASQLRSILLFENFKRDEEENDLLRKRVLLSIVVTGNGRYGEEQIKNILREQFYIDWNESLQKALHSLISNQSITKSKDGYLSAEVDNKRDNAFFEQLERQTDNLIQNIYNRYVAYKPLYTDKQTIIQHIRKGLSAFYKTSGYSFFDIQGKDNSYKMVIDSFEGLSRQTKSCLSAAIGETISNPSAEESAILEIWAKAFVITQMTRLDPMLTNYRQDQLRKKSFVLDTDFVLYVLTSEATYSREYHSIMDYIKQIGCPIYIPSEVRSEVLGCIREADNIVRDIGEQTLISYGDEYSHYTKRNVFVEDFIKLRQSKENKNMPFSVYLRNIYDPKHPIIFEEKLRKLIGKENFERELEYVDLDADLQDKLQNKILDKTNDSPKGQERTFEFNLRASENDARLYLTLRKLNQEAAKEGNFTSKFYLLTRSTKTIYSAKELKIYHENIVCNPQALTTVLQELGDIRKDIKMIDLFDNPFLAYVADKTWEKAEPLLKQGIVLEKVDLVTMRVDVDEKFNDILTGETPEEMVAVAKKYEGKGYKFIKKWAAIIYESEKKDEVLAQRDATIEEQAKKIERLERRLGRELYNIRKKNSGKEIKRKLGKNKKR